MPRIWADGGHCSRSIYGRGSLCHNETGGCSAYLGGLLLMDWTVLGFICGYHASLDTIVSLLIVEGRSLLMVALYGMSLRRLSGGLRRGPSRTSGIKGEGSRFVEI